MWMELLWRILLAPLTIYLYAVWGIGDHRGIERTLDNISRPKTLSRIARKTKNRETCLMALRRLNDQRELAHVARTAKAWPVRKQAIEKLGPRQHQSLLEDIAANDTHPDVQRAAYKKLAELRDHCE